MTGSRVKDKCHSRQLVRQRADQAMSRYKRRLKQIMLEIEI
jgi:hypothetical protein